MDIPSIDTPRLTLRGHALEDYGDCAAMWADPEVTRFIGGRPFTGEEVWARLLRYVGHWKLLGFGYWVIRERTSGRFVGEVGFADFHRQLDPPLGDAPEIGWALATWAHGQGFATEAVRGAVAWGDERFGTRRTVCLIDGGNIASRRVAQKCGYRETGTARYKGEPTHVFGRDPR
jgi:RimJ/RimL family protein N-acetyltransferase